MVGYVPFSIGATTRGRDVNNRELSWVQLTLTDMRRNYNRFNEAATLFNDIVKPATEDSNSNQCVADELDTPKPLAITEQTLSHVRQASSMEADRLLCEKNLNGCERRNTGQSLGGAYHRYCIYEKAV